MQLIQQFFSNLHLDAQSWATLLAAFIPLVLGGIWACIKFAHSNLYYRLKSRHTKKLQLREQSLNRRQAEAYIAAYRANIAGDAKIALVQILDMDHPLNMADLYVPLRVQPQSILRYTIDPALSQAEETHDPNVVLKAARKSLELRVTGAIDPGEAIRQYQRCVIVGNPGVGKTTLLRYLAIQAATQTGNDLPPLPIYVELSTFQPRLHKELFDLILEQLGEGGAVPEIRALLQDEMHAGRVLLLLDGLDETKFSMSDEDAALVYATMIEAIGRLANSYKEMPIVVSVRKAGYQYQQSLQGFHTLEIVDFRLEDRLLFVEHWFNARQAIDKKEKTQQLHTHLVRNLRIQTLASNPLLLSLMVIVYERHLNLPEQRAKLYSQCIEILQSKWDAKRNLKRHQALSPTFQTVLLQEIAWYFHTRGKHYFPEQELLQVIGTFLTSIAGEPEQRRIVLNDITQVNGLLQEQAHGWYGFSHLMFQEYFVTLYVIAHQEITIVLQHVNDPWWEEVLLLYAGSVSDASSLLKTLLDLDCANDLFQTCLILAGRCLGEKPVVREASLRKEIADRLFHTLEITPYTLLREQSAHVLVLIGKPYVNNRLVQLLKTVNPELLPIQESIIQALGRSGERDLVCELNQLLLNKHAGRYLRILAIRAVHSMSTLREQQVESLLPRILMDEQDDIYVRQSSALALGKLAAPGKQSNQQIIELLFTLLERQDEHALVQQSVVLALGALGARKMLPKLQTMLLDEQLDWHVRGSIAKVLGMLGNEDVVPTMLAVLANNAENIYVRKRIAISIGLLNPALIPIESLLAYVADVTLDVKVRCSIARTLGRVEHPEVIPQLLQLLQQQQTDQHVKASLAMALVGGSMKGQGSQRSASLYGISAASERYSDKAPDRSKQLIVNDLYTLLADQQCDLNLKACLLCALAMLGETLVFPDLLTLMGDQQLSQDVLLDILYTIGQLSDREHLDREEVAHQLIKLLACEQLDRFRGQNIVRMVGALGERKIVPDLFRLLEDRSIDRYTRQDIADALARLAQDEESVSKLAKLLLTTDSVDEIYRALWTVSRRVTGKMQSVVSVHEKERSY